jgi:hypothetical protein
MPKTNERIVRGIIIRCTEMVDAELCRNNGQFNMRAMTVGNTA